MYSHHRKFVTVRKQQTTFNFQSTWNRIQYDEWKSNSTHAQDKSMVFHQHVAFRSWLKSCLVSKYHYTFATNEWFFTAAYQHMPDQHDFYLSAFAMIGL